MLLDLAFVQGPISEARKAEGAGRQDKIIFTLSKSRKGDRHLGICSHMSGTQGGRGMHGDQHICCTKVDTQAYRQSCILAKGKALDYFLKATAYKTNKCTNLLKNYVTDYSPVYFRIPFYKYEQFCSYSQVLGFPALIMQGVLIIIILHKHKLAIIAICLPECIYVCMCTFCPTLQYSVSACYVSMPIHFYSGRFIVFNLLDNTFLPQTHQCILPAEELNVNLSVYFRGFCCLVLRSAWLKNSLGIYQRIDITLISHASCVFISVVSNEFLPSYSYLYKCSFFFLSFSHPISISSSVSFDTCGLCTCICILKTHTCTWVLVHVEDRRCQIPWNFCCKWF